MAGSHDWLSRSDTKAQVLWRTNLAGTFSSDYYVSIPNIEVNLVYCFDSNNLDWIHDSSVVIYAGWSEYFCTDDLA